MTDARGVPLVAHVTAANVNDITHLDALVADLPAIRGRLGRPRRRPDVLQATVATIRNHIVIASPFAMNATTTRITPSSRWCAR